MTYLCRYKDIAGKPNEGVHKYRVANIAIVDLGLTVVGVFLLSRLIGWSFWILMICALVISVFVHRLFCVDTTLTKIVFGNAKTM